VVSNRPFRSLAFNGEDIVVWRALGQVTNGRYVDAGSAGPRTGSLTAALAEQGWKGIDLRAGTVLARPLGEVLAEHGLLDEPIHVLALDAGGDEAAALATLDLRRTRPMLLLVRATPGVVVPDWDAGLRAAGYAFRLFSGLFRIYVASEYDDVIGLAVSYPACVFDEVPPAGRPALAERAARAEADVARWRSLALKRWDEAVNGSTPTSATWEVSMLRDELNAMRATLSWRITRPIRVVRRMVPKTALRRAASALRIGRRAP
jgi:hypothetical protein